MKYYSKILVSAICAMGSLMTSCQKDMETYDNKIFFNSEARTGTVLLKSNVDVIEKIIHVEIANKATQEITVTYKIDPSMVETYNQTYYDNAIALPEECCEIANPVATIATGSVKSTDVSVLFKNLTTLNTEQIYVLPISIAETNIDILQSGRTTYYIFKGAALINVVANLTENNVYADWANPEVVNGLSELTAEALIKPNKFDKNISTIMGIEGKFLIRIGDSAPKNQLQIATSAGDVTDPSWQISTGEWTHIAVTYNASAGEIKVYFNGIQKGDTKLKKVGNINWGIQHSDESDGKPRCFWIGYSYDSNRYLDGDICECRIWNRVLTADELAAKNHFYTVDPTSNGLVAYWKFDEGGGINIKDHSVNGNDATASKNLVWHSVALPKK